MIRMRGLRKTKNLTQKDVADILNISRSTVTRYETGEIIASIEMAKKIAAILECSLDDLCK